MKFPHLSNMYVDISYTCEKGASVQNIENSRKHTFEQKDTFFQQNMLVDASCWTPAGNISVVRKRREFSKHTFQNICVMFVIFLLFPQHQLWCAPLCFQNRASEPNTDNSRKLTFEKHNVHSSQKTCLRTRLVGHWRGC